MPELPEVETIKRQLAKKIIGKRLKGKEVVNVRRRAKILIIDFDNGTSLVFHLKLTGQLIFQGQVNRYTRRVFNFDDGSRLVFNDARKLGWCRQLKNTVELENSFGAEPLTLNFEDFKRILSKRPGSKIKSLLMNQTMIAGIGNIYSDEILFGAGVQPSRRVSSLTQEEIKKIFQEIKRVLKAAIKERGSSAEYYVDACGGKGGYNKYHRVYHQKECSRCGAKIKKIKIAGRSSYFCPNCQK